jgi:hypothetical protein
MKTGIQHRLLASLTPIIVMLATSVLSGCQVVEGIFKAGFWSAIILIGLIIGIIIWLFSRKK